MFTFFPASQYMVKEFQTGDSVANIMMLVNAKIISYSSGSQNEGYKKVLMLENTL